MDSEVTSQIRKSAGMLLVTAILAFAMGYATAYAIITSRESTEAERTRVGKLEGEIPAVKQPVTIPFEDSVLQQVPKESPAPAPEEAPPVTPEEPEPGETPPSGITEETGPESPIQPETDTEPEPPLEPPLEGQNDTENADGEEDQPWTFDSTLWVARHLFVAVDGPELTRDQIDFLAALKPGGVILTRGNLQNLSQTERLIGQIKEAVGLGADLDDLPLIGVDQEGGSVNRLGIADAPSAEELGRLGEPARAREAGRWYGGSAVARNIAIVFAPVLDVYFPGTIYKDMTARSFGTDRTLVSAMGLALAQGIQDSGAIPVVKYFPGYGAATRSSPFGPAVLDMGIPELAELMFPFSEAVAMNIPGIVVGHVAVPILDEAHPQRLASLSPVLVNAVLREKWRYDGVILADDLAKSEIRERLPLKEAAVAAFAAGCDGILFLDPDPRAIRQLCRALEEAVHDGRISQDGLADSKKRLDEWRLMLRFDESAKGRRFKVAEAEPPKEPERQKGFGTIEFVRPPSPQQSSTETVPEDISSQAPAAPEQEAPEEDGIDPHVEESPTDASSPAALGNATEEESKQPSDESEVATPSEAIQPPADDALAIQEDERAASPFEESSGESEQPIPEHTLVAEEDLEVPAEPTQESLETEIVKYIIRAEDTVSTIAEAHGVTVADIWRWNNLRGNVVRLGEEIIIQQSVASSAAAGDTGDLSDDLVESGEDSEDGQVVTARAETAAAVEEFIPPDDEGVDPQDDPSQSETLQKVIHTVEAGETLSEIADFYKVKLADVEFWNNLASSRIDPGQQLTIFIEEDAETPEKVESIIHLVRQGENLTLIARKYKTTAEKLMKFNELRNPNQIWVGQQLKIPQIP